MTKTRLCAVLAIFATLGLGEAARAAAHWSINPAHSRIGFGVDAVGYPRTSGVFRRFEGHIDIDFQRPERSRVTFRVDANSLDVGSAAFNAYLESDGFLNATRHPDIDFVSRSVSKLDERTLRVAGDLTLLGVTRPLAVEVKVERDPHGARGTLGFEAHARINRLEFGMNAGFPIISSEIDLDIAVEAAAS